MIWFWTSRRTLCLHWVNGGLSLGWLEAQQTWGYTLFYGNRITHGEQVRPGELMFYRQHSWMPLLTWRRMKRWLSGH